MRHTKNIDSLEVFGNPLTTYHKSCIESDFRENTKHFLTWLHINKFKPISHKDWEPLKWIDKTDTVYTESEVYLKYQQNNK